jgi:integrase
MILRRRILPEAAALGIVKRIGWHSFRHTYATLLKASGADIKVVQESLRHANARITMDCTPRHSRPTNGLLSPRWLRW